VHQLQVSDIPFEYPAIGSARVRHVQALREDRFAVTAPGHEQTVDGYDAARNAAHELADERK
jgi:hypothetical protein